MIQSRFLIRLSFLPSLWTNTADLAAQKETPRVIIYYRGSPNEIEKIPESRLNDPGKTLLRWDSFDRAGNLQQNNEKIQVHPREC